jgi:hypothetical protein
MEVICQFQVSNVLFPEKKPYLPFKKALWKYCLLYWKLMRIIFVPSSIPWGIYESIQNIPD